MIRKGLVVIAGLIAVTSGTSLAAGTWQLQTKLSNTGGNIKVRDKAPQTTAGIVVYHNFTTSSAVPVTVRANTGYTISSVKKGTVAQTINDNENFAINLYQSGGSIQSLVATFAAKQYTITGAVQGAGRITPASATVAYDGAVSFTANPLDGSSILTAVSAGAVTDLSGNPVALPYAGSAKITLRNVRQAQTVTATYATAKADAGIDKLAQIGATVSLNGSVEGGGSATWTQIGGPAPVTLSSATSLTPSFTASVPGTYQFQLSESLRSVTDTVQVKIATSVVDYARDTCNGCHNATGVAPSGAFGSWSSSSHKTSGVSCVSCHSEGAMPTPVNTGSVNPSTFRITAASAGSVGANYCATCHRSGGSATDYVATHATAGDTCSACHNDTHNPVAVAGHADGYNGTTDLTEHTTCSACHGYVSAAFATSQHGTRQGKLTWYSDNLGNVEATELQKGFGNYVNVAYASLPCGKCHNASAWTVGGVDQWAASTGGVSVCTDCHGNKAAGVDTTAVTAPVTKTTCFGCHSRQANETAAGLTDVHFMAGMGCTSCHANSDFHGAGSQTASQLVEGTISAQCENCHGEGKQRGAVRMDIPEHSQHLDKIACSTCHAESMITCHNCHFDNEAGAGGALKAKFFSGRFGGTVASGNSWRFLVNRVMADGSTKVYPGSMQSLAADHTVDGANDGQGHTHAGIAPYYSHTITRVNALTCDKCHGIENAVKLAAGQPVRVTTWNAAAGEAVSAASVASKFTGPKGVIPVPENPRGKLLMDFVDLTNPELGTASSRVLFQKDGPDTIHMPEAFVKPLSAAQMQALANPYRVGATTSAAAHATGFIGANQFTEHTTCAGCHTGVASMFATSQHGARQGKLTWYSDNLGNTEATELQKGFGNYVNISYAALPCGKCHNAAAWTPAGGTDQWAASTGGVSVCTDCHGNKAAGADTTAVTAAVAKTTCFGCHSRQANETAAGLTDVHFKAGMGCTSCHATTDFHGTGKQTASQLEFGTISAQCENCHGEGKSRGPISSIAAHVQHADDIACATCHTESMITCHNCHFDNEAGAGGALKAKFFSGRFGGTAASGNSWRFLVNRVMPDGSTKVYPGSMQSLVADHTVEGVDDGQGHTHAGIAPYYSHTITRVNALSCDKCHGTETAVKLAAGQPVRVTTWNAAAGVAVPAASVAATFVGPKGVIPVPENPRGKLLMDFVDLTNPELGAASSRVLFQKDGPDTIHMPEKYVTPLSQAQMQKLASIDHTSAAVTQSAAADGFNANTCSGCHSAVNTTFATSLHYTRQGKDTFYNHNVGNIAAEPLQKGFGNYVNVGYGALPCADCHNPAAWTQSGGSDQWPSAAAGAPVCTDCHTNKSAGAATTAFDAPVTKATCIGCHSRQANESTMGLTDVHMNGAVLNGQTMNFSCSACHGFSDLHGTGTQMASQLDPGAVSANCEGCHNSTGNTWRGIAFNSVPEHSQHLANIACSTCHMESVITCYGCHFDNEASDPADSSILHAKFASGKFGGTAASGKAWRFLVNRVMPNGATKVYPASMQSLIADRTAANAPGEDNAGWSHAAIAPYYSHSITRTNALKCDKCHGIQNAIDLKNGAPIRVVKWNAAAGVQVPVSSMMATYTAPSGVIPVPENPVGKLLMDFVDLVNPAAGPLNASGTSPSARVLFKSDGPDSIHMPDAYVKPLTAAQINALATPVVRP